MSPVSVLQLSNVMTIPSALLCTPPLLPLLKPSVLVVADVGAVIVAVVADVAVVLVVLWVLVLLVVVVDAG